MKGEGVPPRLGRIFTRALLSGVLLSLMLPGCGAGGRHPVAQPAPGVTTFEPGRFDDLPQYPRSEALGPRNEQEGVVARSFKVQGASPDQIMTFYRDALRPPWRMITQIEKLGVGTLRADWVGDDYRLRVTATRESELDQTDDAATSVVAQYSLSLDPLPANGQ